MKKSSVVLPRLGAAVVSALCAASALAGDPLGVLVAADSSEPATVATAASPDSGGRFRFFTRDAAGQIVAAPKVVKPVMPQGWEDPRLTWARQIVASHALSLLPAGRRLEIAAKYFPPTNAEGQPFVPGPWDLVAPVSEKEFEAKLARYISREAFFALRPVHQRLLLGAKNDLLAGKEPVACCFAPGTDPELVGAFNAIMFENPAFQQTNRWNTTATNGGGVGGQGVQITLTYSFAPDGTSIPAASGFPGGTSTLNANLSTIYGSTAAWQQIYHEMFAAWGNLCGINYVFEPNDDGGPTSGAAGQLGVRGDLRMAGYGLDGNSGVLAYNNFPQNGDMILDAPDSFYTNTGSSSRRLRNVLFHEHGHGMGQLHVCPTSQTKLMEPFISTAYLGPQLDDILNAQRHYGDNDEPNENAAGAFPLPSVGAATQTRATISVDDNADVDFYSMNVGSASRIVATVRPIGSPYIQGPQTNPCDATGTSSFDPRTVNDLILSVIASNGTTVLQTANANPAGGNESVNVVITTPGTYYLRVTGGVEDNIQPYELDYSLQPGGLSIIVASAPTAVPPGVTVQFDVDIQAVGETIVGTPQLFFRNAPGAYTPSNLAFISGTTWRATVPASLCGTNPEFYVQAVGSSSGISRAPAAAPASVFSAFVGIQFQFIDSGETDQGWTLGVPGDTATSGQWTRGDPNGTTAQPEDDNDADGTQCFFTGQGAAGGAAGTADIDGGLTTLLSPTLNLAGYTTAVFDYARWYSNNAGAGPAADTFRVDVSNNNGASWVNARTIGPATENGGGWINDSFDIATFVALTSQVRVRFVAEDAGTGSLVEAAVDSIVLTARGCTNPPPPNCPADWNQDGNVDPDDLGDFINCYFSAPPCPGADYNQDGNTDPDDLGDFLNVFFGPPC